MTRDERIARATARAVADEQDRAARRGALAEQRAELNQQIVDLTEAFLDDITHLQAGQSFAETTLIDYLPRQFLLNYTLAFARRFLVAFLTVTWKLTDPQAVHNCANQAEELALYASRSPGLRASAV